MSGQSQRTAMLVIGAALVVGLAGGVLADRYVLLPNHVLVNRPNRGPRPSPAEMRKRFSERMAKDLNLTPTQRERMDSIYARQFAQMDSLTKVMSPTFEAIWKSSQAQIDSLLDPTQRAKLAELRKQRRGGRGGPGGGPGGGAGGPRGMGRGGDSAAQ